MSCNLKAGSPVQTSTAAHGKPAYFMLYAALCLDTITELISADSGTVNTIPRLPAIPRITSIATKSVLISCVKDTS